MSIKAGKLIISALFAVMLGVSPASALLIGAGQSATMDFDFSALQPAIDASSQPLTLSFTMTTSASDPFDDPAGLFAFQYLDIGAVPVVNFGYDATGGGSPVWAFCQSASRRPTSSAVCGFRR